MRLVSLRPPLDGVSKEGAKTGVADAGQLIQSLKRGWCPINLSPTQFYLPTGQEDSKILLEVQATA